MFVRSAPFVKTVPEWAARSYAKRNMVAVVMCGDDSAVSYLHDVQSGRVVRTIHREVEWAA